MGAFDPCRRESPATVTQPFLMVLMLSSGLVGLETPLHGVCSPSWAIMAQYQSCPFRPEGREGVSVLPQKSQAASCSGVSIHHVLTCSLSTSLFPCIVWLGLLLLEDHGDPVYLLFTLYSLPPTAPLHGCPVPHSTALSWGRPWRRLGSPPPSGLWLLIC